MNLLRFTARPPSRVKFVPDFPLQIGTKSWVRVNSVAPEEPTVNFGYARRWAPWARSVAVNGDEVGMTTSAAERQRARWSHKRQPRRSGAVVKRNRLPLAAREAETGEAETEKGEGGGLGDAVVAGAASDVPVVRRVDLKVRQLDIRVADDPALEVRSCRCTLDHIEADVFRYEIDEVGVPIRAGRDHGGTGCTVGSRPELSGDQFGVDDH